MRFSLRLNNDLTLPQYLDLARAAEAADFDQLWISHDLFLRSAPVLVTAIATATERIELGIGVLNPYTIDPSEIAMLAATLDEVSGGRFLLGLAAGGREFLDWVGIEQRSPLGAVRESVSAIRSLLAGEPAPRQGDFLRWSEHSYLRFPAPRPDLPIYLGAMGPRMLQLAGEIGSGALPLLFPPEHWYTVRELIEQGARERSPDLGGFDLAACIWVSLDEDPARARRALAEKIAYYGPLLSPLLLERLELQAADFDPIRRAVVVDRDLDRACSLVDERMLRIGVVGGPTEVIERLEPLVSDGARHLSFGPPLGPDPVAAVELLGRRVLPAFRS